MAGRLEITLRHIRVGRLDGDAETELNRICSAAETVRTRSVSQDLIERFAEDDITRLVADRVDVCDIVCDCIHHGLMTVQTRDGRS